MPDQIYTASKSRSNRPGWSISFRHPLRNDARGRPGLKMRRGLGTPDEAEADKMVGEMNELLGDPGWWNAAKRQEAELRFSRAVVDALYDEIQAGRDDTNDLREACIHLPTKEEGYSRVLFVGTTGAGKTSLLRQFIGSDPDDDRFPSTAPAKTTIADIEVILATGSFEAVVTFFTEFQVQANIEECITDACIALFEGAAIDKAADQFLNHRDQKFRLSYVLGGWRRDQGSDDEELSFSDGDEEAIIDEDGILTEAERGRNRQNLANYLARMNDLTKVVVQRLERDLDIELNKISGPDREAAQQLVEENFDAQLSQLEEFHDLVQDVLDDVRSNSTWLRRANCVAVVPIGPSCGYSTQTIATISSVTFVGSRATIGRNSADC